MASRRLWIVGGIILLSIISGMVGLIREFDNTAILEHSKLIDTNSYIRSRSDHFFDHYADIFRVISESQCIEKKSTSACNTLLLRLNKRFPNIENFIAVDKQGLFFASGKPFNRNSPPSVATRPFFKELAAGKSLHIMDPHIGPISGAKMTGAVVPIYSDSGQFNGIIGASTKLAELEVFWQEIYQQQHISALILDREQNVISATSDLLSLADTLALKNSLSDTLAEQNPLGNLRIGSVTFNYHKKASTLSGWTVITLVQQRSALANTLITNTEIIILICGFLLLAAFSLMMLRREAIFVRSLIATKKDLSEQRDNLESQVEARTAELKQQEQSFRNLFESNQASIWNEDFSHLYEALNQLREEGVTDLRQYLETDRRAVDKLANTIRVVSVNPATLKMFGAESNPDFLHQITNTFGKNAFDTMKDELCAIWNGDSSFLAETDFKTLDDQAINAIISFPIPSTAEGFKSIPVTILDITEQKHTEDSLRLFRSLIEESNDAIVICDAANGQLLDCNKKVCSQLGYTQEELLHLKITDIQAKLPNDNAWQNHVDKLKKQNNRSLTGEHIRKDGSKFPVEVNIRYVEQGKKAYTLAISRDITERLQAYTALQESEARFRQLFENTPAISVQGYDRDRRVIYWNHASEIIYGYPRDEAIGHQLEDLIIPDHMREGVVSAVNAWTDGGAPIPSSEMTLRRADGGDVDVFSSHVMFRNHNDQPEMYCIDIDLTENRRMAAALVKSEARLKDAQKTAKMGNFERCIPEDSSWWSDELFQLFNREPTLGPPKLAEFHAQIHPDDRSRYIEALNHTFQSGKPFHQEFQAQTAIGEWCHFEIFATVILDCEGAPSTFRGTIQDITERKYSQQSLQKSERRLRAIIDAVPSMIFVKNATGKFIAVNKAVADSLNMPMEEIVGHNLADIHPFPDEVHHMLEDDRRVLESGGELHVSREIYHDGDGSPRWRQIIKVPYTDDAFGEPAVLGIAMDITKLKQTEEALRRTQKMDAIGQLTGGVAHDFNNILGIIIGNLNLLKRHIPDNEKALKRVATIKQSTQRAADLTKQLLGFSRRQSDQIIVTAINQLLGEMDDLIARSVTPEVEVKRHLTEDLWLTAIDPGDFQDALLNLILNARDAMPSGGTLTIETENSNLDATYCSENPDVHPGEYVQLSISDTGEGMPSKMIDRIFEPFFTTKPQGKGTGLGLAMVFGFVERSTAHIKVTSKVDAGTAVRIYFPRSMGNTPCEQIESKKRESNSRGSERVLVVDDEPELLKLAAESLQGLGYQVVTAANGEQAKVQLAKDSSIVLLFSDVVMPGGLNGYQLAEQATGNRPELKVLLTSGYTKKRAANPIQASFDTNLLDKPYTLEELSKRVRALLDENDSRA